MFGLNEPYVLRSPGVRWDITTDGTQQTAHAVVDPSENDVILEFRCGTEDLSPHPVAEVERRAQAEAYWWQWAAELDLPPLKPEAPWYGYSLGQWSEEFEREAQRAVEGRWLEASEELRARQRDDVEPNTSTWEV